MYYGMTKAGSWGEECFLYNMVRICNIIKINLKPLCSHSYSTMLYSIITSSCRSTVWLVYLGTS